MDEFDRRLKVAKQHRKEELDGAGREIYKFCFNGRQTEWDGAHRRRGRDDNEDEIFTDFASTVAEDFAGELFTTMTPENAPWAEYEAGNVVDQNKKSEVEASLEGYEEIIAQAIRKSNYYDEGLTAFKDAVVGNVAMWVDRPTLNSPMVCEAVPIAELYLRLGANGIDDRFREQRFSYRDLPALFPKAKFPKTIQDKIEKGDGNAKVIRGFWMSYEDPSNPIWVQRVRVDGKAIGLDEDLKGDGSCPLLVGRFNAEARSAWGRGPGRRMLPTVRLLDTLTMMNIEGMDRNLDPAYVYANDGMLDLSNGIEPGMGYPAAPGTGESITPVGMSGSLDYGFFAEERIEEKIRDGFYREIEQRGKTPPSASQYMGNQQKQLRRIARPGAKLWREFGVSLLKRTEFLEKGPGGALDGQDPLSLDDGDIIPRPISPLERAQAGDDVLQAHSLMGIAQEVLGPQQAPLLIDGPQTFGKMKERLKDKIVSFRSQKEIMQIMAAQQPQQEQPSEV